jgi:hypothetical protein
VAGARPAFPPSVVVAIKSLACELPHEHDLPLSRLGPTEIRQEAQRRAIVACIGEATLWRWLSEDAIRPWTHRTWICPRDPAFKDKAGRVLDLYEGVWRWFPGADAAIRRAAPLISQACARIWLRSSRTPPGFAPAR